MCCYLFQKELIVSDKFQAVAEHYQIHYRIVVPLESATWYVFSKLCSPFDSNSDKPLVYVWVYYCFTVACIGTTYYFTYRYRSIMYEMERYVWDGCNLCHAPRIFFNVLANKCYPFVYSKDQRYLSMDPGQIDDQKKRKYCLIHVCNCPRFPNKTDKIDHILKLMNLTNFYQRLIWYECRSWKARYKLFARKTSLADVASVCTNNNNMYFVAILWVVTSARVVSQSATQLK